MQQLNLGQVISKCVDVGVLQSDLEQVSPDPVSKFVPVAKHDREPEQLMVIKDVHDNFDEVNAHVVQLDQELVELFMCVHALVEFLLLEFLDQAILLELFD